MPDRIQIADFSDRELLALIVDLGGRVSPRELAVRIFGLKESEANEPEIRRQSRCAVARLAWMRRFGLVDKDREQPGTWIISAAGESLRRGRVAASVQNGIGNAKDDAGLVLANLVGERLVSAGTVAGSAMRRELEFQITRRKRRIRGY